MKDELGGKIMTEFVALRPKTYSYLTDNCEEDKKSKGTKTCVIKRRLKCNDCKDFLLSNEIILNSQQRFKSEADNVYTEEINKTALSSNDEKRLQTFDRTTSYPYGTSVGKACKTEMETLSKVNIKRYYTDENKTEHNSSWPDHPYHPDHPYRILIVGISGSGKEMHH